MFDGLTFIEVRDAGQPGSDDYEVLGFPSSRVPSQGDFDAVIQALANSGEEEWTVREISEGLVRLGFPEPVVIVPQGIVYI